jgi:hypothetical protein
MGVRIKRKRRIEVKKRERNSEKKRKEKQSPQNTCSCPFRKASRVATFLFAGERILCAFSSFTWDFSAFIHFRSDLICDLIGTSAQLI